MSLTIMDKYYCIMLNEMIVLKDYNKNANFHASTNIVAKATYEVPD